MRCIERCNQCAANGAVDRALPLARRVRRPLSGGVQHARRQSLRRARRPPLRRRRLAAARVQTRLRAARPGGRERHVAPALWRLAVGAVRTGDGGADAGATGFGALCRNRAAHARGESWLGLPRQRHSQSARALQLASQSAARDVVCGL